MDGKDIIRLKKAGIDDKTIMLIVREKAIETCAITVQEILDLKKTGLTNETIQVVVEEGSFMKGAGHIVYGEDIKSIKFLSVKDIIKLKDAGVSDKVIQAIVSGSRDENNAEHNRAWEMLKNMGIIIDKRGSE